jgi:hypothetical protein
VSSIHSTQTVTPIRSILGHDKPQDKAMQYTYRPRLDHHKSLSAKGESDTYVFKAPRRRVEDLFRRSYESEAKVLNVIAHFMAFENLSAQTTVWSKVRVVLYHAVSDGYSQGLNAGKNP